MYVKIWPIKSKTVTGGKTGLKRSLDYIDDDEKTVSDEEIDISYSKNEEDIKRTLEYMGNEDKTQHKYISGYLCDPELALEEFIAIKEQNLARLGKTLEDDEGNFAYHIIQSFPEGLDISDDEVHQCGLELCEKLGLYQAVICSHVNPVVDEEGEIHGVCKHNHILINSHCMDPEKQNGKIDKMKYHDCKETYAELQRINDEIAIEHGLPIIDNPDMNKKYSWLEVHERNQGTSWKEIVKEDIDEAKRVASNWKDYKKYLTDKGYEIKDNKFTSYKAPGQERSVRCKSLGKDYTKEAILKYWIERDRIKDEVNIEIEENKKKNKAQEDYYFNPRRFNTKTKKPYYISAYDKVTGRRRTSVELILLLAMVIIKNEADKFNKSNMNIEDFESNPIYGKTDWKLQNMIDTIKVSREEKINNVEDIEKKLKESGIQLSRLKSQMKKNDTALNNMTTLYNNFETYNRLKDTVENIKSLPEGEEKERLKTDNAEVIKIFAETQAYFNNNAERQKLINDEKQGEDFIKRYQEIKDRKKELEEKLEKTSEVYRKYKKLQYHLELAQNDQYCYGPEYVYEKEVQPVKEQEEQKDKEIDKNNKIR